MVARPLVGDDRHDGLDKVLIETFLEGEMVQLYGRQWTREELSRYVGSSPQCGGVRAVEVADGMGRGVRIAEFDTGSGFRFDVMIDRAMDIGIASYQGIPLAWNSNNGPRHPGQRARGFGPEISKGWMGTVASGHVVGAGGAWTNGVPG